MAQYLLTSFEKNGPYYGAMYQDGTTLTFWGAYRDAYCDKKGTPRVEVQQMILDEHQPLPLFARAPLYRPFAVLEYQTDAGSDIVERLDKLKYGRSRR